MSAASAARTHRGPSCGPSDGVCCAAASACPDPPMTSFAGSCAADDPYTALASPRIARPSMPRSIMAMPNALGVMPAAWAASSIAWRCSVRRRSVMVVDRGVPVLGARLAIVSLRSAVGGAPAAPRPGGVQGMSGADHLASGFCVRTQKHISLPVCILLRLVLSQVWVFAVLSQGFFAVLRQILLRCMNISEWRKRTPNAGE